MRFSEIGRPLPEARPGATLPPGLARPIASLRKHRWRLVAVGRFGAVMKRAGTDHLLKLFTTEDTAYAAFVDLASAHPNPHFPRFTGTILRASPEFSVVRVEPLQPVARGTGVFKLCHMADLYMTTLDETPEPGVAGQNVREAGDFVAAQGDDFKRACDLIARGLLDRFNLDLLARDNVMRRGETLVFSDPVAIPGTEAE